jgi:hypothetical protein
MTRRVRLPYTIATVFAVVILSVVAQIAQRPGAEAARAKLTFKTVQLKNMAGATEPRVAVGRNNVRWLATNDAQTGDMIIFKSKNGSKWTPTKTEPAGQSSATIDVDVVTAGKRIIASELDFQGINFRTAYSDDGGKTWTASTGAEFGDTDRQWLAVGPRGEDGEYKIYLLFHNLGSGEGSHNMFVQTSNDSGATFEAPVPITVPGEEAYLDLQCADSGGPSSLMVNQKTGQIYAVWGTRHSVLGGCGAQPLQANIVGATRVWVATSPDNTAGSWTKSLAVDDSEAGNIVGMQLSPGDLDSQGNVYVVYPESPNPYPDYDGAAVKYRYAPPDLSSWSDPVTVAPTGGAGNVLPHIIVGAPGKVDVAWFGGKLRGTDPPAWYMWVAQTLDGTSAAPTFSSRQISPIPTYTGTASELMGACTKGNPVSGVVNGFTCNRSTDVWGIALDKKCKLTITWPTVHNEAPGSIPGTFVSTQRKGPGIC